MSNAAVEVGDQITMTTTVEFDDHVAASGAVGRVVAKGHSGEILVRFPGIPSALTCTLGDDCVAGIQAIA